MKYNFPFLLPFCYTPDTCYGLEVSSVPRTYFTIVYSPEMAVELEYICVNILQLGRKKVSEFGIDEIGRKKELTSMSFVLALIATKDKPINTLLLNIIFTREDYF